MDSLRRPPRTASRLRRRAKTILSDSRSAPSKGLMPLRASSGRSPRRISTFSANVSISADMLESASSSLISRRSIFRSVSIVSGRSSAYLDRGASSQGRSARKRLDMAARVCSSVSSRLFTSRRDSHERSLRELSAESATAKACESPFSRARARSAASWASRLSAARISGSSGMRTPICLICESVSESLLCRTFIFRLSSLRSTAGESSSGVPAFGSEGLAAAGGVPLAASVCTASSRGSVRRSSTWLSLAVHPAILSAALTALWPASSSTLEESSNGSSAAASSAAGGINVSRAVFSSASACRASSAI